MKKLRPELLLAIALTAGVTWLMLDARAPRRAGESRARESGAADPPTPEPALVPVLVPSPEGPVVPTGREVARPEPGPSATAPAPFALAPSSRGRLVDEATLEPIPEALVATSRLNDWTDADGWFDTGDALDELEDLVVVNLSDDASTHEVPKERWTRLGNAWRVPLAIGPTYRLGFPGVEVPDPETWEARIRRESGADDRWHRLRGGPPPYLRYVDPLRTLGPGEMAWLEVRSRDGLQEGLGVVTSLVGIHEVAIACRARAVLRGRVVDENGVPWDGLSLDALQFSDDAEESLRARTGVDGSYQFSARDPGRMQLVLQPPSDTRARKLELAVPLGVTQAPDLVVERRPIGSISGHLQCRTKDVVVRGSLRLRARDGSGYEAVRPFSVGGRRIVATRISGGVEAHEYAPPTDTDAFLFEDVPTGAFELSAFTEDGHVCSPASLHVTAPSEGHAFFFENAVELRRHVLTLVDAESGAVLDGVRAEVRAGGAWSDRPVQPKRGEPLVALAEGVAFEWRAVAPGYRMASGSERDFRLEDGAMVATRALRRGFGVRLRLVNQGEGPRRLERGGGWRSWGTPGVAGAGVLADGELVATSDERGIADLDLPAEPGLIEVRLAGWRVLDSREFREGKVRSSPAAEVWMIRE